MPHHPHGAPCRRETPCILHYGIHHEQCEHPVGLDHKLRRLNDKLHALDGKLRTVLPYHVKDALQRETLNMQSDFSLTQFYPLRKRVVILIYLACKLCEIPETRVHHFRCLVLARQLADLTYYPVYKRHSTVGQ